MIKRKPNENIGITLRGSRPAVVNSIDPGSPADLCGLFENDIILAINDIDVENRNHRFLVDFLQTAGQNPILEVIQKSEYDDSHTYLTANTSSSLSSYSSNSLFEIKNYEGKTFREKVRELFGTNERELLKNILRDYKNKKYLI